MNLATIVAVLNKNKIFKFVSSVKLAVPTMIVVCICVAWGTILESLYNTEYAVLMVYGSWWFSVLMWVLWLNIFCAALSRYPYKKRHTGFVITHIGLLTLLIGGMITNRYGVDGQLQVMEGSKNSVVSLSRLMVGYQMEGSPSVQKVVFDRSLNAKEGAGLAFINREMAWFKVNRYLPFAKVEKAYENTSPDSQETSISFIMKSQFFNVTEWLSTDEEPEKQMGPATLRIIKGEYAGTEKAPEKKKRTPSSKAKALKSSEEVVVILDAATEKEIQKVPVQVLLKKPVTVNGVTIHLRNKVRNAIVAANKLAEGDPSGSNPALEFEVSKGQETKREVLYAKYATFSLNPEGVFGLRLQYTGAESAVPSGEMPEGHPSIGADSESRPGGNVIEFYVPNNGEQKVQVVLLKNGELVQKSWVSPGESVQTPWMGMQLFIGSIVRNSQSAIVARPIEMEKKGNLPPSAIELTLDGAQSSFWLAEGQEKEVVVGNNKRIQVFYGRENIHLPFEIALQKFSKIDYPGTETPMSYESLVQVNGVGPVTKISMNEPLKVEGYTIYQASYSLQPNMPPISVFSVNKDPGRFWKYLGSVILSLGVIIYTFMKSRFYKKEEKGA